MRDLVPFIQDELKKLLAKRQLKILMGLSALIAIGSVYVKFSLLQSTHSPILQANMLPLSTLSLISGLLLPLFIFALGSDLIITEFNDGTAKNILSLPLSRTKLFLGKLLAGLSGLALILLSVFVPTVLGDVFMQGLPSFSQLGSLFIGYVGMLLFSGMVLTMANTLALWTKSAGNGMLIGIVAWIGMGPLGLYYSGLQRFLPNQLDHWYTPLVQGGNLWYALSPLCLVIAYSIVFTGLGLYKFNTKEV